MLREPLEFITHVPIERRDGELYAVGVKIRALTFGPVASSRLYVEIDNALNAKAIAAGSNMPVGLDPEVKFLMCRRCGAPFIAMPTVKLCSDECRIANRRDAVTRSRAKRVEHGWREPGGIRPDRLRPVRAAEGGAGALDQKVLLGQVPGGGAPWRQASAQGRRGARLPDRPDRGDDRAADDRRI